MQKKITINFVSQMKFLNNNWWYVNFPRVSKTRLLLNKKSLFDINFTKI